MTLIWFTATGSLFSQTSSDSAGTATASAKAATGEKQRQEARAADRDKMDALAQQMREKRERGRAGGDNANESPGGGILSLFKVLLYLGVVLLLIYVLYRYLSAKKGITNQQTTAVKKLALVPLFANKYLQVIEVGEKVYLLGVTDSAVNMITEITEKETIDALRLEGAASSTEVTPLRTFHDTLKEIARRFQYTVGGGVADNLKTMKEQKERLRKLKKDDSDET